jgi:hypothetical protein
MNEMRIVSKTRLNLITCDENHERQVESRVQALLAPVDDIPRGKVRPYDVHKLVNSLKYRKVYEVVGIPN